MWLTSWLKKDQRQNRKPNRSRRARHRRAADRLGIEFLEDRVVPSADTLVPGLNGTIVGNLRTANDSILGGINAPGANNAFDTPIPGVLLTSHDINGDSKFDDDDTIVPAARDALSLSVDLNLDGSIPSVGPFFSLGQRYNFASGLGVGGAESALAAMDLDGNRQVDVTELVNVLVLGAIQSHLQGFDATGKTIGDLENDFSSFLNTLGSPDALDNNFPAYGNPLVLPIDLVDLDLTGPNLLDPVANNSSANAFSYSFTVRLNVRNQYLIDLGQLADRNEIVLPQQVYLPGIADGTGSGLANAPTQRFVQLTGSLAMPVSFTVALPPPASPPTPVGNSDFHFAIPSDIAVAVDDSVAGDGGPSLQGLVANVGFLGTVVSGPANASKFNLHMDWTISVTDPSSPVHIGFNVPTGPASGSLTAANPLPADPGAPFNFPLPISFDLLVGSNTLTASTTAVTLAAGNHVSATQLRTDIQAALGSVGSIVTVGLTGDNRLTLTLPATDITPLGFSNEQFAIGTMNAGNAPSGGAALGSTSPATVKFLLNRGGAGSVPKLVTVNTTPGDDDSDGDPMNGIDGKLTLAGLVADVQAALNAAGFTGGNAVTAGSASGKLTLGAIASLELTRTLKLDARNEITTTELNNASFGEFIKGVADKSDDKFQIVMPLDVRDGVDFGEQNNPAITVNADPFSFNNSSLSFDDAGIKRLTLPLKNSDGITAIDDPNADSEMSFKQYLDFNVVGPGEAIGMINQLQSWLQQIRTTDILGGFNLPFAQSVLGNLLAFDDLVHDTLVTDDLDTDDTADDVGKLLAKNLDPDNKNAFLTTFGTAQELGARLNTLHLLTLVPATRNDDGENDEDFAAYDRSTNQLTYQVTLEHLFASANVGADFNEEVVGSLDPISGISTQSKVHLQANGHLNAILGIEMGPGTIDATTKLDDLNGGIGAGIGEGIAFTGASDVQKVFGRLSASATFDVAVATAGGIVVARATVPQSSTSTNETLDDLRQDINAALASAVRLSPLPSPAPDPLPTENLTDRLEARIVLGRVVIVAKDGGGATHFEVTTSTGNTAYTELGLPTTTATSAFLAVRPSTVTPSGNIQFEVRANIGGVFSTTTISLNKSATDGNNTLTDLAGDINAAIAVQSPAVLKDKIAAGRSGDLLFITAIDSSVQSFQVFGTSGPIGELGLGRAGKVFDGSDSAVVNDAANTIKITGHGFSPGDALIYANGGGKDVSGLQNGQTYYVIKIDNDTIQLASSLANALASPAVPIDIGVARSGSAHRLQTAVAGPSLIAANDVNYLDQSNVFGQLKNNAQFKIKRNNDPAVTIDIAKTSTIDSNNLPDRNRSVADLIADINAAINGSSLAGQIEAFQAADLRIGFRAIDVSVVGIQIEVTAGNAAETEMGLQSQSAKAALQVGAIKLAPFFYGPKTNAHFDVAVVGGTSAGTKSVTVFTSETLTNPTIQDLVGDIRRALDTAFGGTAKNPLLVSNDGDRILFKPKSTGAGAGVTGFTISAATTDPAIADLHLFQAGGKTVSGLTTSSTSDGADLLIYATNGSVYRVTLDDYSTANPDDAANIGHVLDSIKNHVPASLPGSVAPNFDAFINSIKSGINVKDMTGGGGMLRIDSVNGSHAAQALGIFGTDVSTYDSATTPQVPNQTVEGTRIATLQLADRFFLRQINASTPIISADVLVGAAGFDGSSATIVSGSKIKLPQHGYLPGTAVVYDHGAGGTDLGEIFPGIGGLVTGTTYYVIVVDSDTIQLAATPDDAANKVAVLFTTGGGTHHQLRSEVALEAAFGFVGVKLAGSGALAATVSLGLQDASSTADVRISELLKSLSKDQDGDGYVDVFDLATLVKYPTIAPTSGGDYGSFTFDVALQGNLDPSKVALGATPQITFTVDNFGNPFSGPVRVEFAAPAAVNVASDMISLPGHGFSNGMEVIYRHGAGGTDIGGLVEGKTYFVIVVDANTIKLSASLVDGLPGPAIDLKPDGNGNAGTGSHQQLQGFHATPIHVAVDADDPDLQDLLNLDDIKFDDVLPALQGLSDFLGQFSQFSFLSEEIPLLGIKFSDLVDIAGRFQTAVTEIVANPAGTIQVIEQKIRETFGLPSGDVFSFDLVDNGDGDANTRDMLKIRLNVEKLFSKAVPVELDLGDQLPGITLKGSAGFNIGGFLKALLSFGVDLDTPTDIYLFTNPADTKIEAQIKGDATNLTFNAALGPAGIFITGGDAHLNLTGGLAAAGVPSGAKTLLIDILGDLTGSGFTPSFGGGLTATLPVFFPTQSNFKGDIKFTATVTLTPEYDLDLDTDLEVPPDILNIDFSEFSIFDSLGLAVDTFDTFLGGVQDILDGEIFGLKIPLIGDKLSAGAEFINDLRTGVIQPFRELIDTAATKGTDLVRDFLFDLLGPGRPDDPLTPEDESFPGLGLLLDPTDKSNDHPDGTPATQSDRSKIGSIVKVSQNLNGPISQNFAQWDFTLGQVYSPPLDFDFDLGFPGLNLDLDGGLEFQLGWTLRLGFGISIEDGPYIVVTRTNSDDPLSHTFPNTPNAGFHDSFEDISPNSSDLDSAPAPQGSANGASGGRVNGLANVPGAANTFFAASEFGGIYKSDDGGKTWNLLPNHLPTVAWDVEASSASQVYATSFYDGRVDSIAGINVSTDGGANWTHPASARPIDDGSASDNTPQTGFMADPARVAEPSAFGISIARDDATKVAIGTSTGLAISHDSGATWKYVDPTQADIFFDTDEDVLATDAMGNDTAILDQYVTFLLRNPSLNVSVSGYTDTAGDAAANQSLSVRRAHVVAQYLIDHGINAARITEFAFGETRLAVPTGDNIHEPFNRRTEINVLAGNVYDVFYQAGGLIDVVGDFGHARSTDDGVHWVLHSLPSVRGAISIVASPDENYVLFAAGTNNQLYESDDGGQSWASLGIDSVPQGRIPFVTVNNRSGNGGRDFDVWFGDTNLFRVPATTPTAANRHPDPAGVALRALTAPGWVQSNDGAHADVGDIVFDSSVNEDALARLHSNDGGVYWNTKASVTQDPTWEQPTKTPHGLYIMGFAGVDQPGGDDEDLYFVLQDDGVWAMTKAGAANAGSLTPAQGGWHNRASADAFDIAADNDRVIFNNGVFGFAGSKRLERAFLGNRGLPGFGAIGEISYPMVGGALAGAVIDFHHADAYDTWGDDKFAMLMEDTNVFGDSFGDGGLFITTNIKAGPINWIELGNATEPDSDNFADLQVSLDAMGNPTFYVTVGGGNGKSADQLWKFVGTNPNGVWTRIDTNILGIGATGISIFAADRSNPNRLYASAMTPLGPQMVRSDNGGMTWTADAGLDTMMTGGGAFKAQNQFGPADFPFPTTTIAANGLSGYPQPTLVAFDPENANIIVAGGADSGLFLSIDNGAHWRLLTDPLGTDPSIPHIPRPRGVHFDHEGGTTTLFVASQGGGIWRIRVDVPVQTNLAPDATEPGNNSVSSAEVFNLSEDSDGDHAPELNDRTIHDATDVDFYKFTADYTGNAIINLYFDKLFGDLDLAQVKGADGSVLVAGKQGNLKDHLDFERIVFPVVQGETYFLKISGASGATGYYDLVVEKSVPELDLFVQAGLTTGTTLTGHLAFLQLKATSIDTNFDGVNGDNSDPMNPNGDPTLIRAHFTVDIYNGDNPGDERLSLFELGSVKAAIGVTADAEANLKLELGLNDELLPDTISAALPTLQADFHFDWQVGGPITDLTLDGGLKLIEFKNIGVDLGSFLSDTVGPIIAKIQEVTEPLQPIVDIITARIPVLSDLAGRTVTLADIAAAFGEFDPGLIYAVADIISLVNSFNFGEGDNLFLKLGDFKIYQKDDPNTPDDESANTLLGSGGSGLLLNPNLNFGDDSLGSFGIGDFKSKLGQLGLDPGDLTNPDNLSNLLSQQGADPNSSIATTSKSLFSGGFSSTPDKSGFDFPIFKDPTQFIGLLLGRDATLITYDLPPFLMNFKWEVSFPIYGPLFGVVSAGVGMKIDLAFGYDTAGVRKFAQGGFENPLDLIGGFFVSDTDKPDGSFGVDVPELVFSGSIGVGAELNAGIASAGVTANIILTVNFDLYDPNHDGKVRIDELVSTFLFEARNGDPLLAPISIFDVTGNIAFQLSAFIKILFARFDFNITPPIVLFEFSIPFDREPILATERGDGSLLLNIGPNSAARQNGDTRDISEEIHVMNMGSGKVAVWSDQFGVPKSAAQIYSIGGKNPVVVGFGGEGDDVIDATELTDYAVSFEGGSGNDHLTGGGKGDTLKGDVGDDTIEGLAGADIITGGEGNDTVDGGADNDIIFGDTGRVTLTSDPDPLKRINDSIRVSITDKDGNDTITGGAGRDIVFGGGGDDAIGGDVAAGALDGAGDGDFLFGDGGSISIAAGLLNFVTQTNADGTKVYGTMVPSPGGTPDPKFVPFSLTNRKGGGMDTIRGHGGADVVFGGSGNDDLDGGEDDDVIYGESGLDLISGGGGGDFIMGGTEDDRIFGRREESYAAVLPDGNDTIFGQDGNDFIRGNSGDDHIEGNAGADIIFGDQDNDFILGQNEPDLIFGGPGRDFIDGGTANDIVFGDDGFVAWIDFGGDGKHKVIGLVGGDPDVYDDTFKPSLTDAQLDALDGDIRGTADDESLTLDLIKTLVNPGGDGNDTAVGGEGDDIIFGGSDALFNGVKGDTLFGDFNPAAAPGTPGAPVGAIPAGDDIAIGDGGRVELHDRRRENVKTLPGLLVSDVGDDTISGNGGSDLLFGGGGNDTIYGRMAASFSDPSLAEDAAVRDDDVIIGDDGEIQYVTIGGDSEAGPEEPEEEEEGAEAEAGPLVPSLVGTRAVFLHIFTEFTVPNSAGTGGVDTVYGNKDDDIIFGGIAGDILKGDDGGDGNDVIFGDNGQIDFAVDDDGITNQIAKLFTTDTTEATGGADTIEGQDGRDVLIGGVNNGGIDKLYGDAATTTSASIAADGDDVILGDNGELVFNLDPDLDTLDRITSYRDALGGVDQVSGNKGSDVLMGGTAGDFLYGDDATASAAAADGDDIMLGDNGEVQLLGTAGRLLVQVVGMPQASSVDLITTTDIVESTGGADVLSGNGRADVMLGGVNNGGVDTLYGDRSIPNSTTIGNDGDDVMLGDNGLLDFTLDDTDRNTLDLIRSFEDARGGVDTISGNKGADVAIGGTAGDTIYGDDAGATAAASDGADMLLGDNADIFLVGKGTASGGDLKLVLGSAVMTVRTTDKDFNPGIPANNTGGIDTISGNAKGDIIAGGVAGDFLYGDRAGPDATTTANEGNDIILGDNGAFEWLSTGRLGEIFGIDIAANNPLLYAKYHGGAADDDLTTLDLITTEQPNNGGRDFIYGDQGQDRVFGGTDSDTIYGDDGLPGNLPEGAGDATNRDVLFGDHGRIYPQFSSLSGFNSRNFFAIDIGNTSGGEGDRMWGEEGDDVMLGQQGDDRMWGGSGDDDMIGGHNVAGGYDELSIPAIVATLNPPVNDLMDGGSGNDAMTGDNTIVWRRGDDVSPRFRLLTAATLYSTTDSTIVTNVGAAPQSDPDDVVGRDIQLVDHSDAVQADPQGRFGNDVMAGGADRDTMFGQLGDDLMQGDGSIGLDDGNNESITRTLTIADSGINPDTDETLYFNIPEALSDADDYMEGNGGNDLLYGGLGQDDMIGGSSALFGLTTEAMRPDGADIIFGGAGIDLSRNNIGDANIDAMTNEITATATGHARDADYIMGDNANVFRPVKALDSFYSFNYDNYGSLKIIPRAMQLLDYTIGGGDFQGGGYNADGQATLAGQPADNGLADLIHGESGDDIIFGMTGSDVIYGEGQDDDIVGGYGHDWISGGTGQDGILGDDGLVFTSRNSTLGEPLYGIAGLLDRDPSTKYSNGNVLDEIIATPGSIQYAVINVSGELKKTIDVTPFSYDSGWTALDDEFPDNADPSPFADDIIFGGLGSDWLHGGSGDDAISGAEALDHAYVPVYNANGDPSGILDLGYSAFTLPSPINPGDVTGLTLNPGNVLAFNPEDVDGRHLNNRYRPGEFALYDEYDPLRKVQLSSTGDLWKPGDPGVPFEFVLNFNQLEGVVRPAGTVPKATGQQTETYPQVNDDGGDAIFGDLGNDWLVGGTGRDNAYGGWGNDLINADDDQTTLGDAPKQGDPATPGANDRPDTHPTYEDRAYGGAGRDVLIANTGGDRLIDWVGEYNSYLVPYAPFGQASVSRTLQPFLPEFLYALSSGDGADPTRATDTGSDPARNGEPAGEMGLVLQKDFAWQAQTGAPADPQAGNIPGGKRDVLRSAGFNTQGNPQQAGFFADSGVWEISNGALQVSATSPQGDAVSVYNVNDYLPNYFEIQATIKTIKPTAGWKANAYVIFDYFSPTDFKFAGIDISVNEIVVGHRNASGWVVDAFTNAQLKPDIFYNMLVAVNGTNVMVVVNGQQSFSYTFGPRMIDGVPYGLNQGLIGVGSNSARGSFDNIAVQVLPPQLTFEQAENFDDGVANLFTGPQSGTWTVAVGRYAGTPAAGKDLAPSIVDLGIGRGLLTGSYLQLSTRVNTATAAGFIFDRYGPEEFKFAAIDVQSGAVVIGHHTTHGWFVDRSIARTLVAGTDYTLGMSIKGTTVSVTLDGAAVLSHAFYAVAVDGGFGLLTRGGASSFDDVAIRTDDPAFKVAPPMFADAPATGSAAAPALDEQLLAPIIEEAVRRWVVAGQDSSRLADLRVAIADLPDQYLGQTHESTIYLDVNAAGYGWFIDPTPEDDSEFILAGDQGEQGRMDLLTVVMHELGHVLGYIDGTTGVMSGTLSAGSRLTATGGAVAGEGQLNDATESPILPIASRGSKSIAAGIVLLAPDSNSKPNADLSNAAPAASRGSRSDRAGLSAAPVADAPVPGGSPPDGFGRVIGEAVVPSFEEDLLTLWGVALES